MRSQRFKDAVFASAAPFAMLSRGVWKLRLGSSVPARLRKGTDHRVWINLGSGASPYPQFINVDINLARRPDMWLDVRRGIPFAPQTVDAIYTRHVLEHFYHDELTRVLADSYRILKPGGWGIVMVPIHTSLDGVREHPVFTDVDRWKYFGQNDHVRLYSRHGFVSRLQHVGFRVLALGHDYFGTEQMTRCGINPASVIYVAEKPST